MHENYQKNIINYSDAYFRFGDLNFINQNLSSLKKKKP